MVTIENDCVDCGLYCLGTACPYNRVKHFYCDRCGAEDILYEYDDEQLCLDCIIDDLKIVEGSGY